MDTFELDAPLRALGDLLARRGAGFPGRIDLIFLKLYAAADDIGPQSRHYTDLLALQPDDTELQTAAEWITRTQDPSPAMTTSVAAVIAHVSR